VACYLRRRVGWSRALRSLRNRESVLLRMRGRRCEISVPMCEGHDRAQWTFSDRVCQHRQIDRRISRTARAYLFRKSLAAALNCTFRVRSKDQRQSMIAQGRIEYSLFRDESATFTNSYHSNAPRVRVKETLRRKITDPTSI